MLSPPGPTASPVPVVWNPISGHFCPVLLRYAADVALAAELSTSAICVLERMRSLSLTSRILCFLARWTPPDFWTLEVLLATCMFLFQIPLRERRRRCCRELWWRAARGHRRKRCHGRHAAENHRWERLVLQPIYILPLTSNQPYCNDNRDYFCLAMQQIQR